MAKKKSKKITTIESLATMVQGEFLALGGSMNNRFDQVNKRLDDLEKEVSSLRYDLDDIKAKFTHVAFRFEIQGVEKRLRRIEIKLGLK